MTTVVVVVLGALAAMTEYGTGIYRNSSTIHGSFTTQRSSHPNNHDTIVVVVVVVVVLEGISFLHVDYYYHYQPIPS